MATLSTNVNGLDFPNPFLIASGPPGTNQHVIQRAYREGWGGVVAKTVCLDAATIVNTTPRYAQLRARSSDEIIGWENIELISDRPFTRWLDEFRAIKDAFPDRPLIASIMEQYNRDAWAEIIGRVEEAGVDALELNFSCPHGLPERRMGSAMGEDPAILEEVSGWVCEFARTPAWAKLTPNVTSIEEPARAALRAGLAGVSAINTVRAIIGIDLDTLRPLPTVEGHSTAGGYSSRAIKPIALRMAAEIGLILRDEFPDRTLSGLGGIESGRDAAEFLLFGAHTVQACTAVMKHGYGVVNRFQEELLAFMEQHGFADIDAFRGHSLGYLTSHARLVQMQGESRLQRAAKRKRRQASTVDADEEWDGDRFVEQSESLVGR